MRLLGLFRVANVNDDMASRLMALETVLWHLKLAT